MQMASRRNSMLHDDVMWRYGVTSCVVMVWRHIKLLYMSWESESTQVTPCETLKITFFNLVTLTFDLWPWHLDSSKILARSTPVPNFGCLRQTDQPWECWLTDAHTHRHTATQTHRRDRFYTLYRWRGREIFLKETNRTFDPFFTKTGWAWHFYSCPMTSESTWQRECRECDSFDALHSLILFFSYLKPTIEEP